MGEPAAGTRQHSRQGLTFVTPRRPARPILKNISRLHFPSSAWMAGYYCRTLLRKGLFNSIPAGPHAPAGATLASPPRASNADGLRGHSSSIGSFLPASADAGEQVPGVGCSYHARHHFLCGRNAVSVGTAAISRCFLTLVRTSRTAHDYFAAMSPVSDETPGPSPAASSTRSCADAGASVLLRRGFPRTSPSHPPQAED